MTGGDMSHGDHPHGRCVPGGRRGEEGALSFLCFWVCFLILFFFTIKQRWAPPGRVGPSRWGWDAPPGCPSPSQPGGADKAYREPPGAERGYRGGPPGAGVRVTVHVPKVQAWRHPRGWRHPNVQGPGDIGVGVTAVSGARCHPHSGGGAGQVTAELTPRPRPHPHRARCPRPPRCPRRGGCPHPPRCPLRQGPPGAAPGARIGGSSSGGGPRGG